jgi:dihydrolipoamide dehydrogenase
MKEISCKLLVIGAGPGGYVCAIRAGQLGLDTVIVEMARPGGTCLNVGCIPSKALIHAADEFFRLRARADGGDALGISLSAPSIDMGKTIAWKDSIVGRLTTGVSGLLKRAGVKGVAGRARFRDGKTVEVETETGMQVIRAETIVIATGSAPVELPALPFGGNIISSTEALALKAVPDTLAVVGGGYIGLELGTAFAKLGAAVTVVEALPRILPLYDAELVRPVAKRLAELGVTVLTGAKAKGLSQAGDALVVEAADGATQEIPAGRVLVTVGRRPATQGFGLEEIDLDMAATSASTSAATPRCVASTPSATSPASRCSPIAPWRRARWWPRSSPATAAAGTRGASPPSASPIPRSSPPACRRTRRARPAPS